MKRLINQLYLIVSLLTLAVLLPQGVQAQGKDVSDYFYYYSEYSETGAPIKTESYSENFYGGNHSFPQLYNAQQLGNISYSSSDESVATVDANGGVSAVGVGSTTITASFPGGDGFEPCSASYTLELTDGRRDPGYLFGWDGETGTGVYGGTASTPILNFGQLGQSPTITFSSSNTTVATVDASGVTIVGVGSTVITAAFEGNDEYKPATSSFTLTISAATVTASGFTASNKTYDGTTDATLSGGTVTGLVGSDVVTVSATGAFADVNVGTGKTVTISGLTLGGADAGNYELDASNSQASTTADITAKTLTVTAEAKSKVYGETDPALTYTSAGLVGNDQLTGSLTREAGENVGSYSITQGTLSASSNYTLTFTGSSMTIGQKEAALSWSDLSFTYDGSEHVPTATVSNLVSGDACTVTVSGAASVVGTYTATATALSNSNYTLPATATQSFTISAATMSGVSASGFSGTYDGAAHGISVTAPSGATVSNGTSVGSYDETASPTYTNVGSNTVYYQVTMIGYEPVSGSANVSITAREAALSWSDLSFTYDGQEHVPTATLSNLVSGDACTVTVTGAASAVGTYTATATALSNSNYTLPASATQSFTISTNSMSGVSASGFSGTYDGAAHGISVTAPSGATVSYGTSADNYGETSSPTYTDAGTYTVYYKVTMTGYDTITGSATVSIAQANGFVMFSSTEAKGTVGESFTAPTVIVTPEDASLTYESSDPTVATVDDSGEVILLKAGSTRITATFDGNANYIGDSHYYDLTVIEPDLVLEPIVKEEDYELSGEDFLNPDGTDKDLSNTVIKSILFTLKNNTSADGDGYDSEESCIVINTVTSLSALQSLLSQGVAPGKQEYARQFTGLTFLVPAGEGYVIIDSQESNGYHLMVQVGSQTPISIYQLERDEFSIPYASTEDTYVYVWNDGTDVEAAARLRTIMKGKKTVANVRIYNVSYRANRPNGIQTVCLDADAADTGWYDLRGQRITQPQKKGLYINNGRKIVIK